MNSNTFMRLASIFCIILLSLSTRFYILLIWSLWLKCVWLNLFAATVLASDGKNLAIQNLFQKKYSQNFRRLSLKKSFPRIK
ncbi:hypothetical protein BpHYR1_010216 [Brachionus plicatilis]|uniref:Uncharacterized protein n=1 Tax=Brachionus plicatilis TaxID=10195 RepID=A0A3M7QWW5_BRAPC|nr:hypothetical protein BpHYR1_010216 [Brachionus plicatilis]